MTEATLANWRTAPINSRLEPALTFMEKLTTNPEGVGVDDIFKLCKAGVTEDAILDVIGICAGFNIIDRVADALDFEIPSIDEFVKGARLLLRLSRNCVKRIIRRTRSLRLRSAQPWALG